MLSTSGFTQGLLNIFGMNAETMSIDTEAFLADIETYGLFTYEEFNENFPVPEILFEAFQGQYLKVSMGKGYLTWEMLDILWEHFAKDLLI